MSRIIKAKKSLGQNFFADPNLAKKIVKQLLIENSDGVIEIGPGTGNFTSLLSQRIPHILSIEKDTQLFMDLQKAFPAIDFLNEDITTLDTVLLESFQQKHEIKRLSVFGSLPYNISKQIIRKLLPLEFIHSHFYIIQKEVAEKYLAVDGNNLLSLTASIFCKPQKVMHIGPESFTPRPKVDSTLIKFTPLHRELDANFIQTLEKIIKEAFTQPRKMLSNNLKGYTLSDYFKNKRASELSLDEYISITRENI